ncbi:MAG: hypothetical protein LBB72_01195 [Spirochaetaceae bacterium]|jgi:hypothetical protein|nr:hypothetical protein [Spirochaetaceae bacterium]
MGFLIASILPGRAVFGKKGAGNSGTFATVIARIQPRVTAIPCYKPAMKYAIDPGSAFNYAYWQARITKSFPAPAQVKITVT